MTTMNPIHQHTHPSNDPERAAFRSRDTDPIEYRLLADAEEEELAELWASDPGNQGS